MTGATESLAKILHGWVTACCVNPNKIQVDPKQGTIFESWVMWVVVDIVIIQTITQEQFYLHN